MSMRRNHDMIMERCDMIVKRCDMIITLCDTNMSHTDDDGDINMSHTDDDGDINISQTCLTLMMMATPTRSQAVRDYFGEKVALYFAWLGFYTYWLLFPAILGALMLVTMRSMNP